MKITKEINKFNEIEAVQSTPMKSSVKIINKKNLWLYLKKCSLTERNRIKLFLLV